MVSDKHTCKNKDVRKVGRLTEMTQHLVNGWTVGRVGGFILILKEVSNMTVQDLYHVLAHLQFIEIYKPCMYVPHGVWSGRAKDIPSCYFESKIIKVYSIFYKCNTEFSFIVVYIE